MDKFYLTTSIPYANGAPHLGHAMEYIQADVLARYYRQYGQDVMFVTGLDEHGAKNLEKATEAGLEPQAFVDQNSQLFQALLKALNISHDRFIRTTSPEHKAAAQQLWQKLVDSGDIYKGTYKGYYDVGEEEFVTETEAKRNKGISPQNGRPYEILEEENYFFKLTKYTDALKELVISDQYKVVPSSRKNEILQVLEQGLQDISFSRPKAKLPWGIEVPGDPDHVMYVWSDALGNYITAIGYPDKPEFVKYWPADVHVVGKNITRFHAIIWPAMLLGLGLPLPKALYAHGFITVSGQKMGKSLGNSVDPNSIIKEFGTDAYRYYFLREIPSDDDGDYNPERFAAVYNSDLANDLGNLVQRTIAMIAKYQNGQIGEIPEHSHDVMAYHEAVRNFRFDKALAEVWTLIKGLNQYIDEQKPWEVAKQKDAEHLAEIMKYLVSNLLQVAELLAPFLPETAEKIKQSFASGVATSPGVLFPKHESE